MDNEQADWAIKQVNEVQRRMGKRYSLSRVAVEQFGNNIRIGEEVVFAEKMNFFYSDTPTFVMEDKEWKKFSAGVLVFTNQAIHILSKTFANRHDLRIRIAYHVQFKESDQEEEVTLLLDKTSFVYFQIRRPYLDPLIAIMTKLNIRAFEFELTHQSEDGTLKSRFDNQRIVSRPAEGSEADREFISIHTSERIPDEPGSFRARLRKKYGRKFQYKVGEPDVVQDIVRPWE